MAPCAVAAAPAFSGGASRSSRRSPGLAGDSRIVGSLAPPVEGRHFYQGREADTVPLILNGAFNFRAGGHQPSRRNICFCLSSLPSAGSPCHFRPSPRQFCPGLTG